MTTVSAVPFKLWASSLPGNTIYVNARGAMFCPCVFMIFHYNILLVKHKCHRVRSIYWVTSDYYNYNTMSPDWHSTTAHRSITVTWPPLLLMRFLPDWSVGVADAGLICFWQWSGSPSVLDIHLFRDTGSSSLVHCHHIFDTWKKEWCGLAPSWRESSGLQSVCLTSVATRPSEAWQAQHG